MERISWEVCGYIELCSAFSERHNTDILHRMDYIGCELPNISRNGGVQLNRGFVGSAWLEENTCKSEGRSTTLYRYLSALYPSKTTERWRPQHSMKWLSTTKCIKECKQTNKPKQLVATNPKYISIIILNSYMFIYCCSTGPYFLTRGWNLELYTMNVLLYVHRLMP